MMTDKEKVKKAVSKYFAIPGNDYIPTTIVGMRVSIDKYFFPWLDDMNDELHITTDERWFDKAGCLDMMFTEVLKRKNIILPYVWLHDGECLVLEDGRIYVGIDLEMCNKAHSLNRILIDVRNDFIKLGFIEEDAHPNIINFWSDFYFVTEELKKEEVK